VVLTFHILRAPGCEWVGDKLQPALNVYPGMSGVTFTITVIKSIWKLNPTSFAGLNAKTPRCNDTKKY
jgi:hypothetical protein